MGNREKNKHPLSSSQQLNPYLLTTPFAAVVLLQFLGWIFPGNATWGFNFWSLVDSTVAIGVFATAALLLIPSVSQFASRVLRPGELAAELTRRVGPLCAFMLLSAFMLAVFYYFASKALVYGDGFTVLNDASDTGAITLHFQYKFQLLSVYFHRYTLQFISSLTSLGPLQTYRLANAIGGVIGMWALIRISGQITSTRSSRAFVLLGALSSASIVLFFGYIENYTWAFAMALWALSYSISYAKSQTGVFGLVIFSALAFAFHMITLPFVLVALMSLFMRGSPSGNYLFGMRLAVFNAILTVGALLFVALSQLADIDIFVSLAPRAQNPYWVLSRAHLLDVLNEFLLVAGLGLALLVFDLLRRRTRVLAVGVVDGVLGSAALLTFLATFWIDPGIGAPRDWDLLSFAGIPLTLWALYRFIKIFPSRDVPSRWVVPVIVVLCVHLGANLYEKNHPALATVRLDALLSNDIHYQHSYNRAQRCIAWAVILQEGVERSDLAIKHLTRRADAFEESHRACFNLGDIYCRLAEYDSAAKYIEKGLQVTPDDVRFLMNMTKVERLRERYVSSAVWAQRVLDLEPANVEALTDLGIALSYCDHVEESLHHFRAAYLLAPGEYNQIINLGYCHGMLGQTDSAYCYIHDALELAPDPKKVELYVYVITAAIELGRKTEASEHLHELRQIAPNDSVINELSLRLAQAEEQ